MVPRINSGAYFAAEAGHDVADEISPFDSVIQIETKSFELRIFKESCSTSKESSLFFFFFFPFYSYVIRNYCK